MTETPKTTVIVLFSVVLMDLIGFGIMIPLLPYYAMSFGASSATLGIMTTVFSVAQMIGNVVLGIASDKCGRRRVLCLCLLGSAVSYGAFGCATSLEALILLRGISGFFSGTIGCAQAYVTAVVSEKDRRYYLGYIGACIGAGFTVGPGLGALLASVWGFRGPCFFAAGMCLANFLAGMMFLIEPPARVSLASEEPLLRKESPPTPPSRVSLLKDKAQCLPIFCSTTLYYTAFAIFDSMGALYLMTAFDFTPGQYGILQTIAGVGGIVVQKFFCEGIIVRLGEAGAGAAAHIFRLVGYMLVATCSGQWAAYALGALISGGSILAPCSAILLSSKSPAETRGAMLGLNQTFASFGRVLGPLAAAAVYDQGPVRIWYVAAACSVIGAALLFTVQNPIAETTSKPEPPLSPRRKETVSLSRETLHRSAHPARDLEQGCPEADNQQVASLQVGGAKVSVSDAGVPLEVKPVPVLPAFPVGLKLSQPSSGDSEAALLKVDGPSLPAVPCFPSLLVSQLHSSKGGADNTLQS